MPIEQPITLFQGNDHELSVLIRGADGNPTDISSYTAKWALLKGSAQGPTVLTKSATILSQVGADLGKLQILVPRTDTKRVAAGRYYYEVVLIDGSGKLSTATFGEATVKPSGFK